MKQRSIPETEVEEAWTDFRVETPGRTPNEINLWGYSQEGRRRLRITVRAGERDFVISVVAPDEEDT